ncbi:MAG: hypothetical protein IJF58_01780 [Clostridia bacterium]|nr:hypothetical protein [Clostridia bacterium]
MKNNQLNFDFDNAPIQSPQPTTPVDRTVNTSKRQPSGILTAEEVKNMGADKVEKNHIAPSPIAEAPKTEPVVKSEPVQSAGYSNAAMEILRRMQISEADTSKSNPGPATYISAAQPSEMGDFLNRRQSVSAEKKEETAPVKITEDVAVADMRREKADAFKLDTAAMAAGFESIDDSSAEQNEPLDSTSVFQLPEEEAGTRMFDAVAPTDNIFEDGGSTIFIPDDFVAEEDEKDEEEIIDDYTTIEDAQSVSDDLTFRKRKLGFKFVATVFVALLLIIITLSDNLFPFGHVSYYIAVGVLLLVATVINLSSFQSLISVFKLKPDVDFAPALAVVASFIQLGVCAFFGTKGLASSGILAAAAVVSLAFNTLSKRITVSRTLANFDLISNEEDKEAAAFIGAPASASILNPKKHGETLILGRRTTVDMAGFISYSLSPDLYEKLSGKMSVIVLAAAVIAAGASLIMAESAAVVATAFASVCCLGAQIAASYPSAVLLNRVCKKLRNNKVMFSGFKAAEELGDANVIVLDSDEIFNDECVSLFKFRTFGGVSPDIAFMTAAALTTEGHSPLAGMFNQIAATTGAGMLAADSVIYENSMGLTGWVDEKKTLLGNRMIMESHSIPVPSMEIDRKILKSGKFPLYLAIDDKIAAMFIIGYSANRRMLHSLRRLNNTGATLLVRTVDPNVTADLVCSVYGLPTGAVEVMASDASRYYCDRMSPTENEPALLCTEDAKGFVDAFVSSISLNRSSVAASITVVVLTCLVMALNIALSVLGVSSYFNLIMVLASYLGVTAITAVVSLLRS